MLPGAGGTAQPLTLVTDVINFTLCPHTLRPSLPKTCPENATAKSCL